MIRLTLLFCFQILAFQRHRQSSTSVASARNDQERRHERGQPLLESDEARGRWRCLSQEHYAHRISVGRLHRVQDLVGQVPRFDGFGRLHIPKANRRSQLAVSGEPPPKGSDVSDQHH